MSTNDYERYQTELEFASILGMPFMGTGNDPTSANNRNIEPWTIAGREVGGAQRPQPPVGHPPLPAQPLAGVQLPPGRPDGHGHRGSADRCADPADGGPRRVRQAADAALPRRHRPGPLCVVELDIYWAHVAQHQYRWRYDWDGNRVEDIFDPLAQVATADEALPAVPRQGRRPDRPGTRRRQRLRHRPVRRPGDIDFQNFFKNMGAKGFHNPNYEQDNAPGGSRRSRPIAPPRGDQRRTMTALRG